MKKLFKTIALVLALMMVLCSCGKTTSADFSDGLDDEGHFEGIKALDYFTIDGDIDNIVISDEDIQEEIEYLVTEAFPKHIEVKDADRVITETDSVNIDYVGKIDGVEFEGGSTNGAGTEVNIATTSYIEGFLPQLVGHKVGDTFDINVTFPDPYESNKDLSGKAAVFTTTVNYIVEHEKAEFNDEFVKQNLTSYMNYYYGVTINTADEYREYVKQAYAEDYVIDRCVMNEDAEIPESVQEWVNRTVILSMREYAEKSQGVEMITYLKKTYNVSSEEEFLETQKEQLKNEAKNSMLMQALAEHYDIKVGEDVVKAFFSDESGDTISYEDAVKTYGLKYLKHYLLQDELLEHIKSLCTVE